MRARVRLGPDDVGQRVTVRTRIHEPGEPPLTDTVGVLEAWRDGLLEIRRRDGTLARLREADLVAARRVTAGGRGPAPR
jgi:hypothetical protein